MLTTTTSAYLLVSHGSRDPRPKSAMGELGWQISKKISKPVWNYFPEELGKKSSQVLTMGTNRRDFVGIAYLELVTKPLHQQIINFARLANDNGCDRIQILPLFLLEGVHLKEDIPSEVALAQKLLGKKITLDVRPHLGSHFGLQEMIAKKITNKSSTKIIVSHGSRRRNANVQLEVMAENLGAAIAYTSISPNLESLVLDCVTTGSQAIAIVPYFLFPGNITDTIAQTVEKLTLQFPAVSFQLTEPIGASTELAELIWDLVEK
ncbi:MAG: sirohydrochlorin chelatase [Cyanobacteria bacterium P01_A01_bin.84]